MAEADDDGAMAAVLGLDRATVSATVETVASPADLVVANDNAPGQIVISGRREAIAAATEALRGAGAKRVLPLPVSGAFHSPSMADVADRLAEAFEQEAWHDARVPVVSNVTAEPESDAGRIRALLAEQVRSPVEWVASVERLVREGVDEVVELGPGSALVGMVRRIAPNVRALAAGDPVGLTAAVAELNLERAGASA
jgi:[acyl-carrier-protein] S-malonyltransferase